MENKIINYKRFTHYPINREILKISVVFHVNLLLDLN